MIRTNIFFKHPYFLQPLTYVISKRFFPLVPLIKMPKTYLLAMQAIETLPLFSSLYNIPVNTPYFAPIKTKPPILIYDASKIEHQLSNNYILRKYMPIFEKEDLSIPYVIETFPTHGISGSYTLPPKDLENIINNNTLIIEKYAQLFLRYYLTMYGGPEVKDIKDVIHRMEQLFVSDNILDKGMGTNLYPVMQHLLSLDTYNLNIARQYLDYANNINVSAKYISPQKHIEIKTIQTTHSFLIGDELRVINENNKSDILFLNKYEHLMKTIVKQPYPEVVGERQIIGINEKVIYPIDTKLVTAPEKNLDMLSSYSSLSPNKESRLIADKIKGQYSVKSLHLTKENKTFLDEKFNELAIIIKKVKLGHITKEEFEKQHEKWTIRLFEAQIKSGKVLYDNMSFLPSIIANTSGPLHNYYITIISENLPLYNIMLDDIKKNLKLHDYFPTMQQYKTFDLYKTNLAIMQILKRYGLIENYYTVRKLLAIKDVHDL